MEAIFVQARLKSTRLPQKVMLQYNGNHIIGHQLKRIRTQTNYPVILVTSTHKQDDSLEDFALSENIPCFRGSEDDVIERFTQCAIHHQISNFYLIYGDEPFTDIGVLENNFKLLHKYKEAIIYNTNHIEGTYGYGFTQTAAQRLNDYKTTSNNEVWGLLARKSGIRIIDASSKIPKDSVRLTIDYPEDFEVFKIIMNYFGDNIYSVSTEEIATFYLNNNLADFNACRTGEYNKRIQSQGNF